MNIREVTENFLQVLCLCPDMKQKLFCIGLENMDKKGVILSYYNEKDCPEYYQIAFMSWIDIKKYTEVLVEDLEEKIILIKTQSQLPVMVTDGIDYILVGVNNCD